MTGSKETFFEMLDSLIDSGVDITKVAKHLPIKEYNRLRKQAVRVFGSYEQALTEYGLFDSNGTPNGVELHRCFTITDDYEVSETDEVPHLCDVYALDELSFRRLTKGIRKQVEIDALDEFYRDQYPFDHLPTRVLRETYPVLYGYLRKHYGTYKAYLAAYGVSYAFALDRDFGGKDSAKNGHRFEYKLGEILREIYGDAEHHRKIGDCIPDFIVNGTEWIDAKLSAGTIYDSRCRTVEKYARHTDELTVYYALGKAEPFTYEIANVLHVSTLYSALERVGREDLVRDMESFITAIDVTKEVA
ncbi:hypothetical protein [Paenibacillus sp.]|uniref:hypothetical protein n=1 Tax=Paenibacillus sp. TaxID=58172 RepID=UPI0028A84B4F|nr:hypothetical protein [Paenibacillus sp.]